MPRHTSTGVLGDVDGFPDSLSATQLGLCLARLQRTSEPPAPRLGLSVTTVLPPRGHFQSGLQPSLAERDLGGPYAMKDKTGRR